MALALVACASGGTKNALEELKTSVDAYNEAFRWKNYPAAARYRTPDERTAFLATFEENEDGIHVEDVQVLKVNVESDEAAEIIVRYRYMKLPSVTIDKVVIKQSWHRVNDRWVLEYEEPPLVELVPDPTVDEDEDRPAADDPNSETSVEVETPWER